MYDQIPLRCLDVAECGRVAAVCSPESMRRRFYDMGIAKGTVIRCLFRSPGGDPTAYAVRGAVIAIRAGDAEDVLVTPISGAVT